MWDREPRRAFALLCGAVSLCGLVSAATIQPPKPEPRHGRPTLAPPDTVTFSRHIAPILFAHCAACHRPGEAAPFSLLSYQDAKPWARRIAEVTQARIMPPWLPKPGYGEFEGERRLTREQIALIARWVELGAPEGNPADLPDPPRWVEGWQLGEPDLVLRMDEPYVVPDSGTDIFRNFVIPVPLVAPRWIAAVELRPGNAAVVHHAVVMIDRTPSSRLLSERESDPGFEGMHSATNAQLPEGFLVAWAPGTMPSREAAGTAWSLDGETDLVLQLHVRPRGSPDTIRAVVGLYFADDAPVRRPVLVKLVNELLDIPAGERHYVVRDEFLLPVDVEVLSLFPHAHYLGKDMKAFATLPDGRTVWLLHIEDWDFNWQDRYRFTRPVALPGGAVLRMEYTFDNSADNPQNPHHPPRRVLRGLRSSDEMAELFVQLLARDPTDDAILARWVALIGSRQTADEHISHYRRAVEQMPDDAESHFKLGVALDVAGEAREAVRHLRDAMRLGPDWWRPVEALAWILAASHDRRARNASEAVTLAERAVQLTQRQVPEALDALGAAYAAARRFGRAAEIADDAAALAHAQGRHGLADAVRARAELYRRGRPYVRGRPRT